MYDWIAIKNEYVNTTISQRKLAEKYNIPIPTLLAKANKEKWKSDRDSQHNKNITKVVQKTAEKIINDEVNRIAKIMNLADVAMIQVEIALQELKNDYGKLDTYKLRQIVQSIKDLKEVVKVDPRDNNTTEIEDDRFIEALNAKVDELDWSDEE